MNRFEMWKEKRKLKKVMCASPRTRDIVTFYKNWVESHKNDIFRYWVYKKVFTPYEESEKFTDESVFEDDFCTYAQIVEVMPLIDGDLLLGFKIIDDPYEGEEGGTYLLDHAEKTLVAYHRFSDIELEWVMKDDNAPNEADIDELIDENQPETVTEYGAEIDEKTWYNRQNGWDEGLDEADDGGDGEDGE